MDSVTLNGGNVGRRHSSPGDSTNRIKKVIFLTCPALWPQWPQNLPYCALTTHPTCLPEEQRLDWNIHRILFFFSHSISKPFKASAQNSECYAFVSLSAGLWPHSNCKHTHKHLRFPMVSTLVFPSFKVMRLCDQATFIFTVNVNYRFEQAACKGLRVKRKMPEPQQGAVARSQTSVSKGDYCCCFLFWLQWCFHLTRFSPITSPLKIKSKKWFSINICLVEGPEASWNSVVNTLELSPSKVGLGLYALLCVAFVISQLCALFYNRRCDACTVFHCHWFLSVPRLLKL